VNRFRLFLFVAVAGWLAATHACAGKAGDNSPRTEFRELRAGPWSGVSRPPDQPTFTPPPPWSGPWTGPDSGLDTGWSERPDWCERDASALGTVLVKAAAVFAGEDCFHSGYFALSSVYWWTEDACVNLAFDDIGYDLVADDGSVFVMPWIRERRGEGDPYFTRDPGDPPLPPPTDGMEWLTPCVAFYPEFPFGP
jgi:hypothetical protein